jgi:hypothetical protein
MIWWIIFGLFALSAIGGVGNKIVQAQEKASADLARQQRLSAYADFLRRTSPDPALREMTEREIFVYLDKAEKELKEAETAYSVKSVLFLLAGIAIVVVAFIDQPQGGIAILLLVGFGLFAIDKRNKAKRDAEQARIAQLRGLDAARLLGR